jgi:hypothetical protein
MKKNYSRIKNNTIFFDVTLKAETLFKKAIVLVLLVFGFFDGFGQTTLISPTVNNGGFETGLTGWLTAQTGVGRGAWYSGTATFYAGSTSAYISRNTGTNNNYLGDQTRFQHLYKQVTFPAGETIIDLSFYWKALGEGVGNDWDNLKVFVSNAIPIAGAANAAADQVGATWYNSQTTWQNATITLPTSLAGATRYLIFQWKQDASGTYDPPAAIDNITLTSQAPTSCSGTPTAGTVTVNPTTGVAGSTYGVTATGITSASGLTFQWQYSDTGGAPWSNQGTATSSYTALTGMIAPAVGIVRTWKLVVTCTASGLSANSSTGTFTSSNCIPTSNYTSDYISNFATTGGVTNISNPSGGFSGTGYGDFYSIHSASLFAGSILNFVETYTGGSHGLSIWIDLNNNGVFETTERLYNAGATAIGFTGSLTVPLATLPGDYRMRVRAWWNNLNPDPCNLIDFGEAEDYKITILTLTPCATPTTQPTALNLTVSGTTINGSFTAATPAPSGYLIVRSSSATPPTLTNGTTYAVGFTGLAPGTTRVIQGSAVISNGVTFSDTGLIANTQYYYHIFSYNTLCTGTPFYLTTTPLTNTATTCIPTPTSPVNSAITSSSFTVTWSASAGALNYVLEVYTNAGYTIPIAGSPFTVTSPTVTYNITGLTGPTTYYYRIRATNATCSSGYVTGTVTTLISNDNCSGAIPLTVSSICNYTTYTNAGATASTGMTAPGCANYSGGDVWFSAIVPATGEITVDLQSGGMTDSGVAFYSGTCGTLALLDCDDDSSLNGAMSLLTRTGLTPGTTIYIRVWGYGGSVGSFGICVSTPSCPSPSDLYANILSTTSVTVNWTASAPPASGGYQYFINNTGIAPTVGTTPTGTTAPGVISVTFNTLTPGLTYYFWVRSFCGGSDISTWFGPTNYTPCAVGGGTAINTTNLSCTVPFAGTQGSVTIDPTVTCSASTCANLEVTYAAINQTTNYTVAEIPYDLPYQYTCLQNPVSVNIDDVWSPIINLPFNFCFYGNNYNRCLIGSNGVISFDTTTYAPGGYNGWSFTNNLPNTNLIRNAIFGVYQDIDPSKGGQVGYELINLSSGCRALVASWNDIPMYSAACNSIYYTGMIVLYENSNVIDVYVKEKNICATWNGGNAIVGIQNAAGTAAVFPTTPTSTINTNDVNSDWTATNKAWRFTPSGPVVAPTFQWYQGNNPGTGTLISGATNSTYTPCPSVTTNYCAEVTYPLCTGTLKVFDGATVTVTNNKVWNGSVSTAWNTANNWTPSGVPVNTNCVIIPNTVRKPIISAAPDAVGYNLSVYTNAQLTINSNQNLTITDAVTVQPNGIFTINNSASLIQINNVLNSGNITYHRTSPNIRTLDYVYWSSPVANFNVSNIVLPYVFGPIYHWNTTVNNANGGQGTWQNFAGNMQAGKGYIARAPGTSPFNNSTFNPLNGTFTGVPNNGTITIPIERGNDQNTGLHYGTNGVQITNLSDNWNLLGNPYPSALRGSQFLFDNNTKIEGNIRLWTHGNLPIYTTNPFYNSFVYNYTSGDYLTYNFTGTSCCPAAPSDLFIGSGQGFFVQMIDGPQVLAASNVTVAFNNNQRSAGFDNSIFYRTTNPTTSNTNQNIDISTLERNRIWLDLVNSNGQSDRTLFGYVENATMGIDSFFDCITQNSGGNLIYSEINDTKFNIQGRSLPFDINDEVSIGINAPNQGNYSIAIAAVDGLFNNQTIYLKDNLLNITHNLKSNPYQFTTISGGISDRFKIVYVDNTLANPTQTFDNSVKVIVNNEVAVSSSNVEMDSIVVYNLLGQELDNYENITSNYVILSNLRKTNTTLLLKIKLQTGEVVTKKIIY